ncbi:Similar to S.cerevisiae protein PSH1 (E3 ubiquitin ligase targeting centromere-binding protein Cse4p) [Malassezia sympodialis ATCC 42132]|uniref:Similar to S.cerevisiae protein PSH1 (E3 ubiquitin ligase targeting centromere-binding protein Cse4p) n=1 Tax=Malassezia sympodialis (strain ATCC 42132) TaxID=1230383 RepID=A0A1M8ACD6_MALS4|nr:Similar to S.cerevisiae protein PSH1 (E3 ubiquitin ligase targeting centromere-binding protein Cse4p) [Malassezia sympodialis ATCC 42132]
MRGSLAEMHKRPRLEHAPEDGAPAVQHKDASVTLKTIEQGLLCGVCMELYDRPCALSPCGHIFCAECLVSWFSVAEEVAHTSRNARRKKVCPSCRAQVVTPPLELWALKGVLQAVREHYGHTLETPEIQTSLWDGLFDPSTFYHVIRDQDDDVLRCGMCSSEILEGQCTNPECGIVYENLSDDEEGHFRGVNLQDTSEGGSASSQEEDAGSLDDFVVGDEEHVSEASSDSGIVSVSPPKKRTATEKEPTRPSTRTESSRNQRQERLQALMAARARRGHGANLPSESEEEDGDDAEVDNTLSDSEEGYEVVQDSDYDSDEADEGIDDAQTSISDTAE